MTIMTIYDSLTGYITNWDTRAPLRHALLGITPADDERIQGIVADIENATRTGDSDLADTLATALGFTMRPRKLAFAWDNTRGRLTVCIKEWDPYSERWIFPVEARLIEPVECLLPGDDWEDDAPYTAAEDRLLAAVGLTRDDISETIPAW